MSNLNIILQIIIGYMLFLCQRVICAHYERIYDNLVDAIENGAEKVVKDEEVIKVLEILETATEVARSHKA